MTTDADKLLATSDAYGAAIGTFIDQRLGDTPTDHDYLGVIMACTSIIKAIAAEVTDDDYSAGVAQHLYETADQLAAVAAQ